jgi:peptidoglycan/xylan/chitin deacetylase (PgdA/CDA1 family)
MKKSSSRRLRILDLTRAALELPLVVLGVALYHLRLAPFVIWLRRHSTRVLMFHAVEAEESPFIFGLSINTPPIQFAAQLDFLVEHYHVVSISACRTAPLPARALVITFDDGLRSVYQHAFPLLKALGAPATCYLCTDVIGNHSLIWLNELAWFLHHHSLRAEPIVAAWLGLTGHRSRRALVQGLIARYDRARIGELLDTLRGSLAVAPDQLAGDASLYLTPADIEDMAKGGIAFGNHSASHAVLSLLSEEDCRNELTRARDALDHFPGSIPSLAYPFGLANDVTRRIAVELGYNTLLEVEGRNHPVDPLRVGRVNVTSDSPAVLFARVEIVAPAKCRIKEWLTRRRSPR